MQDSVAQGNRSIALFSPDTIRDRYPVYAEGLRHRIWCGCSTLHLDL
jgi:hypothetical protein